MYIFLRLGYNDITVFEKEEFVGGLNTSELPAYRFLVSNKTAQFPQIEFINKKIQASSGCGRL